MMLTLSFTWKSPDPLNSNPDWRVDFDLPLHRSMVDWAGAKIVYCLTNGGPVCGFWAFTLPVLVTL